MYLRHSIITDFVLSSPILILRFTYYYVYRLSVSNLILTTIVVTIVIFVMQTCDDGTHGKKKVILENMHCVSTFETTCHMQITQGNLRSVLYVYQRDRYEACC